MGRRRVGLFEYLRLRGDTGTDPTQCRAAVGPTHHRPGNPRRPASAIAHPGWTIQITPLTQLCGHSHHQPPPPITWKLSVIRLGESAIGGSTAKSVAVEALDRCCDVRLTGVSVVQLE